MSQALPPPLTEAEGRVLLWTARAAILKALGQAPAPHPAPDPADLPPDPHSLFVTLRIGDRLRGCIGILEPREPLGRVVADCAHAAAFEDPRFEPLRPAELPGLTLEVSVLGPRRPLHEPAGLLVGVEGLVVSKDGRSGLLLPSVAVEQGWGALEFLEQACRKAGLPRTAWREGARVEAFRALVFRETPDPA